MALLLLLLLLRNIQQEQARYCHAAFLYMHAACVCMHANSQMPTLRSRQSSQPAAVRQSAQSSTSTVSTVRTPHQAQLVQVGGHRGQWNRRQMSFTSSRGMPEDVARGAMRLPCYTANVQGLGASLFAGNIGAEMSSRAVIGKRGDLLGIYVGNQMRTVKQHKELHKGCRPQVVSGVGYAAELCGMMLDARVDPTGLALVNELGAVNVWMMKVDLETEDGATVSFYADFLATTLREHDELRTCYGGSCYEDVRMLKGLSTRMS